MLVDKDAKAGPYPHLSAAEASTPLFAYNGGQITVGDYIDSFRQAEEQPALGDSIQVIRAAWKLPIPKAMVWEAAKIGWLLGFRGDALVETAQGRAIAHYGPASGRDQRPGSH